MDSDEDGRWMTYIELADIRGIDQHSVRRMAHRAKWRRQKDNHGTVRIYVPNSQATRPRRPRDKSVGASLGMPAGEPTDLSVVIRPLEAAIATLREQLEQANSRADRAEAARDAERAQVDALRDRLNAMQEQLADAHAALEAATGADARAHRAEADRDAERVRADRAEQGREADRSRADALQAKINAMQVQLTARQEVVDAAEAIRKADDARLAHGRWARLRTAWRGG